jgi:hypothetical protein
MIGEGWRWEGEGGDGGDEEIERGRRREGGGLMLDAGRRKRETSGFRGKRTGRSSTRLRSHSSPSSNFMCQMSSASVDTSWSVTTPRYQRWPNFIRTSRPAREIVDRAIEYTIKTKNAHLAYSHDQMTGYIPPKTRKKAMESLQESGGCTRCSRRYCRGNRRVRVRVRVGRGWIGEVEVEGVVVEGLVFGSEARKGPQRRIGDRGNDQGFGRHGRS